MIFKREPREDLPIDTLISARTRIQGDVQFTGGLHVDGTVTGRTCRPPQPCATVTAARASAATAATARAVVRADGMQASSRAPPVSLKGDARVREVTLRRHGGISDAAGPPVRRRRARARIPAR
jgi:hypothetical protein